jgi:pimeloyl-ACP methyl ester carboxylesterase
MGIDPVAAQSAPRSRQPRLRGCASGLQLAAGRLAVLTAAAVSTVLGPTTRSRPGTGGCTAATLAGGDEAFPTRLAGRSRWVDLDGPVHYLDFGGPSGAPTVVCVHGLIGSAATWSAIAPQLTGRYRVLAPDLSGHGLTRSLGRGTHVRALQAQLHRFLDAVCGQPVILIGNSMGGTIALLETAAAPGGVSDVVLVDPALPLVPARPDRFVTPLLAAYATPVLGPRLMRRHRRGSPQALVDFVLSLCCVDPARVPTDVVAQLVAVAGTPCAAPTWSARSPRAPGRSSPSPGLRAAWRTGAASTRSPARCCCYTAPATGWYPSR